MPRVKLKNYFDFVVALESQLENSAHRDTSTRKRDHDDNSGHSVQRKLKGIHD